MNNNGKLTTFIMITALLCLAWSADIRAREDASAYVEMGALASGNWTSTEAGGSGMPSGETFKDYVRSKSCDGWDRLGMKGGYLRCTQTAERRNAGDKVPTQEQVDCIDRLKRIQRDSHGQPSSLVFSLLAVSNQRLLEC